MSYTLFGLTAAASLPGITALLLIQPTGQELISIAAATLAAAFLTLLIAKKQSAQQNIGAHSLTLSKDPKSRAKALFAPTHQFLHQLRKQGHQSPEVYRCADAIATEVELLANQLDWVQSSRDTYEATVLISDLRGFTTISETYSPDEIVSMLNRYFEQMSKIIYRHNGTIDKLMGDSILAVFGSFDGPQKDAKDAVTCAAEMQLGMSQFNQENHHLGMPSLYMGIGLNTGIVVASKLGSELYNEQTVIGADVNLAARIESHTVRGQVLISESTYNQAQDSVEVGEPMHVIVKGKRESVAMYELLTVTHPTLLKVPEREIRRSPRVDVDIPFKFHICEGKIITSEQSIGRISNISAGGMLAYSDKEIDPYFFVRFALDFNVLGIECNDIYGKILKVVKKEEGYEMSIEFTIIDASDRRSIHDLVNNTLATMQRTKYSKM